MNYSLFNKENPTDPSGPESRSWKDYTYVYFDTETSGAYPVGSEIVEIGAVKWQQGQIVDRFQTLLKPQKKMTDFIIGIHGITNEMVADAPVIAEKIGDFHKFIDGAIVAAHHAPFDLGFMALEFEKAGLALPTLPALCSSLLARKMIKGSFNHKLQTLIQFLNLPQGQAHRAQDDAEAGLAVLLHCLNMKLDEKVSAFYHEQEKPLYWNQYAILNSKDEKILAVYRAIQEGGHIDMVYDNKLKKEGVRRCTPLGIIRNPDGDYFQAHCHRDNSAKRFYFAKIYEIDVVAN